MTETTTTTTATLSKSTSTIGIDLGDRKSHICVLDEAGQIIEKGTVATTPAGLRKRFERCEPTRIAIEAGGQSGGVNDLLTEICHDVIVANPRKLRMIYQNESKQFSVSPLWRARCRAARPRRAPRSQAAVPDPAPRTFRTRGPGQAAIERHAHLDAHRVDQPRARRSEVVRCARAFEGGRVLPRVGGGPDPGRAARRPATDPDDTDALAAAARAVVPPPP